MPQASATGYDATALLADVVCVVVFCTIGRRSHAEESPSQRRRDGVAIPRRDAVGWLAHGVAPACSTRTHRADHLAEHRGDRNAVAQATSAARRSASCGRFASDRHLLLGGAPPYRPWSALTVSPSSGSSFGSGELVTSTWHATRHAARPTARCFRRAVRPACATRPAQARPTGRCGASRATASTT